MSEPSQYPSPNDKPSQHRTSIKCEVDFNEAKKAEQGSEHMVCCSLPQMESLRTLATLPLNQLESEKLKLRINRIVKEIETGGESAMRKRTRKDRQVLGMISPKQNRKNVA